jgi:NADPH:quinone reductase-like Zn-dependent oxidoreductase
MRAISVKNGRGIADDMFIDNTVPEPVVTGDRILVRIRAFGLNRMDIWQRENEYPYKLPDEAGSIMGVEFSGVVEQKGPECMLATGLEKKK